MLVIAERQLGDYRIGKAPLGGILDAGHVLLRLDTAHADIVACGKTVADEILEDYPDMGMDIAHGKILEIDAVHRDAALVGVIEPGQQLDDGGLARAILAHQSQRLAGLEGKVQMAQRPGVGIGIAEANILKHHAGLDRLGKRLGLGRRNDGWLDLEEGEQVIKIHRLPGNLGKAQQQLLEQAIEPQKRARQEGKVADREIADDGPPDDKAIGTIIGQRRDRREQRAPEGALGGNAAIVEKDALGQRPEPLDQEPAQAEQLDLLGRLGAGPDMADIFELAPLRRAPAAEHIGQRVEPCLAPYGRHKAHRQQQDQPGRIDEQPRRQRCHGDDVLRLAEHLAEQGIAPRRLAPGALQLVLIFGRFEMHEIEPRGMGHQLDADRIGMQFREHRIDQPGNPVQQVGHQHQAQFHRQQHGDGCQQAAGPPVGKARPRRRHRGQCHHGVDQQLADIEHGDGLQRRYEPQADAGRGQRLAGAPDLRQQAPEMAQIADALTEAGRGVGKGRRTAPGKVSHGVMIALRGEAGNRYATERAVVSLPMGRKSTASVEPSRSRRAWACCP